jgi:DNA modification methylase
MLPTESIHAVISDPMYGCGHSQYDWGSDPNHYDPEKHWQYHQRYYEECRRVLVPGGTLIWAQSTRNVVFFDRWFGEHLQLGLVWSRGRTKTFGIVFVVQTKEQQSVPFPNRSNIVICKPYPKTHPCAKPVEMMSWLVEEFTSIGDIVLDPFCGIGSTLIACKQLGRHYIGCDIWRPYCKAALQRLRSECIQIAI